MKKYLTIFVLLALQVLTIGAKEYSYLTPPTISVMDFEVTIEKIVLITEKGKEPVILEKEYLGKLINHTLVTVLIHKNASNTIDIEEDRKFPRYLKGIERARYFPPLLKIYDKKYIEIALEQNNFLLQDLYDKNAEAFNFADLDFVVLGNVFEEKDRIGLNVRVLNTYRGEELYSYVMFISKDLSDLHEVCSDVAENIIIDILKNYCSQFMVRRTEEVQDKTDAEDADPKDFLLFCQSKQEIDNENITIPSNDTYKKLIYSDLYYWILPGDYTVTVYSRENKSIREIDFTINPREIKLIPLEKKHFEEEKGSIVIQGIFPVDSFTFHVVEKPKDAEYIWEVGRKYEQIQRKYENTFKKGEFDPAPGEDQQASWSYKAATNEIVIKNLGLAKYEVKVTPVAEAISKASITGIVKLSSRQIETSEPIEVDLKAEKHVVVNIENFQIKKEFEVESYRIAKVSFFFNPGFSKERIDVTEKMFFGPEHREGFIILRDIEKLVIEDEYSKDEWDALTEIEYNFFKGSLLPETPITISKKEIDAKKDLLVIVDFENMYVLVGFKEKIPILEREELIKKVVSKLAPTKTPSKKTAVTKQPSIFDLFSKKQLK